MFAVDTNLIVRYLVADDPDQTDQARNLIDGHEIFICTTVMLETEWVLRRLYGFSAARCVQALTDIAGLPRVILEDAAALAQALNWAGQGMDFADALHLTKADGCEAFISFDRALIKAARTSPGVKVRLP